MNECVESGENLRFFFLSRTSTLSSNPRNSGMIRAPVKNFTASKSRGDKDIRERPNVERTVRRTASFLGLFAGHFRRSKSPLSSWQSGCERMYCMLERSAKALQNVQRGIPPRRSTLSRVFPRPKLEAWARLCGEIDVGRAMKPAGRRFFSAVSKLLFFRPLSCMLRALRTLSSSRRLNTNAMAAEKVIFYDLVSTHEGPHPAAIPPNTWKGRLALLHKGVDFELKYLTFTELRAMAPKLGVERPVSTFAQKKAAFPISPGSLTAHALRNSPFHRVSGRQGHLGLVEHRRVGRAPGSVCYSY